MNKNVAILGGLLTVALVGSYLSWTSEDEEVEDGQVTVIDAKPEQLSAVTYSNDELLVELSIRSDDRGSYVWVKTTETEMVPVPPEPAPLENLDQGAEGSEGEEPIEEVPEPEPELVEEISVTEFKGGDASDGLLASLAPLLAERQLDVAPERYDEFGLLEPEASFSVTREGKPAREFTVGGEAYGSRDLYVLESANGSVYLFDQEMLRPLRYATTRLPDRTLQPADAEDIVAITVIAGDQTLALEHFNRSDREAEYWGLAGATVGDESAGTWLGKALGLKAKGYVQPDRPPSETVSEVTLRIEPVEGEPWTVEVFSGTDIDGKSAWYARSEHTRELVELHPAQASELVQDLETILPE